MTHGQGQPDDRDTTASETRQRGGHGGAERLGDARRAATTATGTITFTLTQPDGTTVPEGTVTVSGDGTYASPTVTATQVGTYTWQASYSGDGLNNGAVDDGGDESLTTVMASPTITTTASETGDVVGTAVLSDAATAGGRLQRDGHDHLHADAARRHDRAEGAVTVSGDGTYASPTVTATEVGTYTWQASYAATG